MTSSHKVIVIGAGHNGLVCAAYLARAGHQVQVLEARDIVGGGANTETFAPGYQVSGLAHLLHSLNPAICKELGLDKAGFQAGTAVDSILLDKTGSHITLTSDKACGGNLSPADIEAYASFKKEFKNYARALSPLMENRPPRLKNMDTGDKITLAKLGWKLRFGLGADAMQEFLRVGGINIYDVLNEVFTDERLKGGLAADAVLGHHMGPRTPNTVLTYLHRLRGEIHGVQSLPPGGMGHVAEVLAKAATSTGASIKTAARVARILVNDGRATGVELDSGEQLTADVVVSNADAKTTFLKLVAPVEQDAMFVHRISKTRTNGNVAKLHLALDKLPEINGLSEQQLGQRLLIAPDMRYVEHAFNHAKYGEFSDQPVLEISIPSLNDTTLAPEGHHVMSVVANFAPYKLKAGWENGRKAFEGRILDVIEQYAPGLSGSIVASELLTPVDIEQRYNLTGGHWHHGEMSIDQSFMMRPVHGTAQYNTPVAGLFLCGAASHPGGGINGTAGRSAANRILGMNGGSAS